MRTLVLIVLGSVLVSILGLALVRSVVPLKVLEANNDVAGNYLQTLGTVYAVLLAFVVFVVWSQFNEARNTVEQEANELADFLRVAEGFPQPVRGRLSEKVQTYIQAIIAEEWEAMVHGRASERTAGLLEELGRASLAVEPRSSREELLYTETLTRFNALSDARSHRLLSSRTRLPRTLRALLIVGSVVTVGSMYLFGLESFLSHALKTGAMAGSVAFVLLLIFDLDNPFWGDWQVTSEPLRHVLERVRGSTGQ